MDVLVLVNRKFRHPKNRVILCLLRESLLYLSFNPNIFFTILPAAEHC